MALGAAGLSALVLRLDRIHGSRWLAGLDLLYGGGTDGARAVLSTIAGSMITTAGVAFSITIVALTLASSQFGSRLLRNFIRDRGNQVVLGTFIATYLYCVLILRTVVSPRDGEAFVPHLSITVGVLLALASLAVLIYFIHHIAVTIQADHVIAAVGAELARSVDQLFPNPIGHPAEPPASEPAVTAGTPLEIASRETGYVQIIDTALLVQRARGAGLFMALTIRPGDFVVSGQVLARIWPRTRISENDEAVIRGACAIGPQRTQEQDIEFPIHQLVQIAVRALSPAVNDPFTAIACVERLGAGLCLLAGREFPPPILLDSDDAPRVRVPATSFERVVGTAFDQIREYGRSSSAVTLRLLETIGRIAVFVHGESERRALRTQAELVERAGREALTEPDARSRLAAALREALERLDRAVGTADRPAGRRAPAAASSASPN
jgi:uncharacterized membrane protein